MATGTAWYNLTKPASTENYNLNVWNTNLDMIDEQMHQNETTSFTGATELANGTVGNVPAPTTADKDKFLKGDGTWAEAGSSNVEANPSGTPTETLETIGIDNVIYQLPEGGDTEITGDAEGSVISIDDGKLNTPLKACTVDINPVQSGSGTPSPSNIRPISGWTEANVTVADATVSPTVSTTYNIEFEDGGSPLTVYGGTLDAVSGVLTVDRVSVIYDGSDDEGWTKYNAGSASAYAMRAIASGIKLPAVSEISAISNYLVPIAANATWGNYDYFITVSNTAPNTIFTGARSITTVESWKTYLASNNLQVVYELATPQTYQLTPTQIITTLYGKNVIWADSGDMAIKYVRDTSIAINDALNQSITPTYSSGTKIADYNIGGHTGAIYVQGAGGHMDTLWTGNETPTMSYNPTITLSHPISDYDFLLVNFNNYNGNFYLKSTVTLYGLTTGDYVAQEILPAAGAAMFVNILNDNNITLNCYGGNYENTTYVSVIGVKL